jgi:pyruvate dehydrogenase E1 component alpha subunit/2-oxoisovalerate dehydrogenase E1 component alpha subunit
MISHLGAMIPVVNGMLLARRMQGGGGCVGATCIGDGATSTGAFHEALNMAAIERLPLILVVANNQFAYSTPTDRQFACESISDRAPGYGVQAHRVVGNDLLECMTVCGRAVELARAGGRPQLIEADLLRLCGHGEHDDAGYIPQAMKDSPLGRDCLKLAAEQLIAGGHASPAEVGSWREAAIQEVDDVIARVQREPAPDPFQEDWCALASRHLQETHSHLED